MRGVISESSTDQAPAPAVVHDAAECEQVCLRKHHVACPLLFSTCFVKLTTARSPQGSSSSRLCRTRGSTLSLLLPSAPLFLSLSSSARAMCFGASKEPWSGTAGKPKMSLIMPCRTYGAKGA